MRRGWFGVMVLLGFAGAPHRASAEEQGVTTAVDGGFTVEAALALLNAAHPLVRAAEASVRAAEADATTAGHWTNPVLDATYIQAVRSSSYDPVGAPVAGVTQFLELSGAPRARRRSAEAEARATASDRTSLGRGLEWTVREAFVRLAAADERVRVRRDLVVDLRRAQAIVDARVLAGFAPRYDASRLRLAVAQAVADVETAEADRARARGDLDVAVGPRAGELHGTPRLDLYDLADPAPLATFTEAAMKGRPDLLAAQQRAASAAADVDVAKKSVFPGFGVRLGAGFGQGPGQMDVAAGVVVPLPLVERGQGTVRAAEARATEARLVADAVAVAAMQHVRAAHAELVARVDALRAYRQHTGAPSEGMRVEAEAGYREARLSILELVDAYASLRDARLRLLDLAEGAQVATIAFRRATMTGR